MGKTVEETQKHAFESENAVHLLESQVAHQLDQLSSLREREEQLEGDLESVSEKQSNFLKEREELELGLKEAQRAEHEAQLVLERTVTELEHKRQLLSEAQSNVENAKEQLTRLQAECASHEAQKEAALLRKQELQARLERIRGEKEEIEQSMVADRSSAEETNARIEGLSGGRSQSKERKQELETELDGLRAQAIQSERTHDALRASVIEKKSRLASLEEIWRQFEGFDSGTRSVMNHFSRHEEKDPSHAVVGMLADRIDCPEELTQALAAALGEKLRCIIVPELSSSTPIIEYLSEGKHGRATFVAKQAVAAPESCADLNDSRVVGRLLDSILVSDEDRSLVERFLGKVFIVNSLQAAIALHDSHPGYDFVTPQGDFLDSEGLLTGGGLEEQGAHVLQVKREVKALSEALAVAQAQLHTAEATHTNVRKQIAEIEAATEAAQSEAHDTELAMVEAQSKLRQAEQSIENKSRRLQLLEEEQNEIRLTLESLEDKLLSLNSDLERSKSSRQSIEQDIEVAIQVYNDRKEHEETQSKVVTDQRVTSAELRQKSQGEQSSVERLSRSLQELEAQSAKLREDLEEGKLKQEEMSLRIKQSRENLAERKEQRIKDNEELERVKHAFDEARQELSLSEEELKGLRGRIEEDASVAGELAMKQREATLGIEHLLDQIQEKHNVDLRFVVCDFHHLEVPHHEQRARAEELNRLLSRMGEVNLLAIEEFEEKNERYVFLTGQQSDLESALEQLESAIRKMNKESRKLFKEAFDSINTRFQKVFPAMFGGGKGELVLTEPHDLLETGVDIIAKPPGKRIGSIELMSGGEKALTAVSLIFSIFQHKPSPFCLLDEVDAPLDEANIDRFNEAIRTMSGESQFIIITHSRRSMELTDRLYGVTMEAPGVSKMVSVQLHREDKEKIPKKATGAESDALSLN
ncbi:MAG: chromosome segregation protein SMC [Myxococcales bacterium]|nr:MAG: chromosome segregation protein SMC [Myxococcales bacterium]